MYDDLCRILVTDAGGSATGTRMENVMDGGDGGSRMVVERRR